MKTVMSFNRFSLLVAVMFADHGNISSRVCGIVDKHGREDGILQYLKRTTHSRGTNYTHTQLYLEKCGNRHRKNILKTTNPSLDQHW